MELHERIPQPADEVRHPFVDPFAEVKNRIHLGLIDDLGRQIFNTEIDPETLRARVSAEIATRLSQEAGISREDREQLAVALTDDILGYGPLERLLTDDSVTEVMVNGPHDVWLERNGQLQKTAVRFTDESHLRRVISKMVAEVGRRVDEGSPMVDARMPDGSRINAVIPPLSLSGSLLTIRKFGSERLNVSDLIRFGTLTPETAELLERCVEARLNILISGGTGAGKTTLLNALSAAIPDSERIVTIEDAAELRLVQRHVLRLECRPSNVEEEGEVTVRDLVRNSLRMRPDRIIVGEVRGAEALDMLQALNTGHDGSLSTVHANSTRDALARVETMVLMAGYDLPLRAVRQQVTSALDLIIQLERMHDGSRKVIAITEVQRMESDIITLQDLFAYEVDAVGNGQTAVASLKGSGLRPLFLEKFVRRNVKIPAAISPQPVAPPPHLVARGAAR
jgi:pilus assembly protein CpaF